jgi:hypothetical protein
MNRRSTEVQGCVNFPIHRPSTNEGGMVVKLWVIPENEAAEGVCCDAVIYDQLQETFIGTDDKDTPYDQQGEKYFIEDDTPKTIGEGIVVYEVYSVPLLASVVLGSTGWSGEWCCSWQDLTSTGKSIVDSMKVLYPNAEYRLITILDT